MADASTISLFHGASFRRCLLNGDAAGLLSLARKVTPHEAPGDLKAAEYQMHLARSFAGSIPLKLRRYSHRWLAERGVGSLLPEHLWPKTGFERENSKRFHR